IHARENNVELDVFGKRNAVKAEIDHALKTLEDSGSIDYAKTTARKYVAEGKAKLNVLPDTEAKDILLALADYMIERKF
ncbi:MAG: polyprenyl synthetase family protein, partial [Methanosarcinales archaeon]|nr:polyprenyl synthetase family protein [Methanosarcinales archaeon]